MQVGDVVGELTRQKVNQFAGVLAWGVYVCFMVLNKKTIAALLLLFISTLLSLFHSVIQIKPQMENLVKQQFILFCFVFFCRDSYSIDVAPPFAAQFAVQLAHETDSLDSSDWTIERVSLFRVEVFYFLQDLMEMFITYQIPSDLMSYDENPVFIIVVDRCSLSICWNRKKNNHRFNSGCARVVEDQRRAGPHSSGCSVIVFLGFVCSNKIDSIEIHVFLCLVARVDSRDEEQGTQREGKHQV